MSGGGGGGGGGGRGGGRGMGDGGGWWGRGRENLGRFRRENPQIEEYYSQWRSYKSYKVKNTIVHIIEFTCGSYLQINIYL